MRADLRVYFNYNLKDSISNGIKLLEKDWKIARLREMKYKKEKEVGKLRKEAEQDFETVSLNFGPSWVCKLVRLRPLLILR